MDASKAGGAGLPRKVTLIEVGPRDGFQFEKRTIPTDLKVEIINGLVAAGLTRIQVTAFVHPGRVPQVADAERLLAILPKKVGVIYDCLVLNHRGLERAFGAGATSVEISASASDIHSLENTGLPREKAFTDAAEMIQEARGRGLHVRGSIQCAFGFKNDRDVDPEYVASAARCLLSRGPDMLALADTAGVATPAGIKGIVQRIADLCDPIPLALHLHNNNGLGYVNAVAAIECGITHLDTAFGGLGGCPFLPGASGNISTEKTAYLMSEMGIGTGVDVTRVATCTERLQRYLANQIDS